MENVKVNMTPLVDVCMSLLIVFMVSGSLILQPSLKVEPPEAYTNEEKDETDKIILYISNDGKYAIDDLIVDFEHLEMILSRKLPVIDSGLVVVKADRDANYGDLVKVMAVAKKAGASNITIATKQKEEKE